MRRRDKVAPVTVSAKSRQYRQYSHRRTVGRADIAPQAFERRHTDALPAIAPRGHCIRQPLEIGRRGGRKLRRLLSGAEQARYIFVCFMVHDTAKVSILQPRSKRPRYMWTNMNHHDAPLIGPQTVNLQPGQPAYLRACPYPEKNIGPQELYMSGH